MENGMYAAFPLMEEAPRVRSGLTKRELFAAMAMQGILASGKELDHGGDFAKDAIYAADALLKALEEK